MNDFLKWWYSEENMQNVFPLVPLIFSVLVFCVLSFLEKSSLDHFGQSLATAVVVFAIISLACMAIPVVIVVGVFGLIYLIIWKLKRR